MIFKTPLLLHLLIALALSSCVGDKKPTTNAQCASGFSFDPVSRSCFAAGSAPVGTLTQVTVLENSGMNLVQLSYRDGNKDPATSCQVINDSASTIEVSSPRIYDLASRSQTLLSSVESVFNVITPLALAQRDLARNSVTVIRAANSLPVALSGRDDLISSARFLANTAVGTGNPVAISSGNALLATIEDYAEYFETLSSRCHCEAGVCRTALVPRVNNTGNASFRYSVADQSDGSSSLQQVIVSINPVAKRPVARSGHFGDPGPNQFLESDDTAPLTYSFIPSFALGTLFNSTYSIIDPVNLGEMSGCVPGVNFPGVCFYTPFSGDLSDEWDELGNERPALAAGEYASVDFHNMRYTAAFKGSAGNDVRIRYIAYQGLGYPAEGSVRVLSDAIGPIIEITVVPNQTLNSVIAAQVNSVLNDARLFVEATVLTNTTSQAGVVNLANGQDAQDAFKYRVCNGLLCSEGGYTIRIIEQDDKPYIVTADVTFNPTPILEDVSFDIELPYLDPDSALVASACQVDPLVTLDYTLATCSCDAFTFECTASLTTRQDFNGPSTVRARVENTGRWSDWVNITFNITPVNDAPFISPAPFIFANDFILENNGVDIIPADNIYTSANLFFNRGDGLTMMSESGQSLTMSIEITDFFGNAQDVIPMSSSFVSIRYGATTLVPVDNNPLTPFQVSIPSGLSATTFTLRPDKFKSTLPGQPLLVIVTLRDNGGVANGGADTTVYTFQLDVVNVNFPPTISNVASVQANEGGEVYSPNIFITEGGESAEADQSIQVRVLSDNPGLLPPENITLHYNLSKTGLPHVSEVLPGASNAFQDLGDGLNPSADAALILRMKPVGGVTGTSNITIYASDGTTIVSQTFPLVVYPVSARHGGWNQIKAVSNKVFSASQLDPSRFCSEHTNQCNTGGNCRGNSAPNSSVSADDLHAIFFDQANQRCYFSTDVGVTNWQELNTFCPITKTNENTNCLGASCMGTQTPIVAGIVPTAVDQYYFNYATRTCFRSEGTELTDWVAYFPSQVTLGWNDFVLAGSGADTGVLINGWQVFRRRFNTPFDFSTPIATLPSNARTYVDSTVNENSLYYYVVRPIDNKRGIATATNDVFSEIRVMTPPRNMTFVHRWMVNQEVCGKMNKTIQNEMVDPERNFRCAFTGPGAIEDPLDSNFYYDIGRDLFVDVAEAGCPFTPAPTCTSNGCIGVGPADVAWASVANRVYYDRANGTCYRSGAGVWTEVQSSALNATFANATQSVLLPPLVNITQARATNICAARSVVTSSDLNGSLSFELPSRLDQMGYAAQPLNLSDTVIEQIERGLSLNSSSKCNASGANGVSGNYTSGQIPPSSFYYSLPGTSTSGIRSVATGSIVMGDFQSTQACVSRYGIQDVYGNVAEWVRETMTCTGNTCTGNIAHPNFDLTGMSIFLPAVTRYGFDGEIGPCRDVNADGVCDPSLTSWLIQDKNFSANFLTLPMGLPIHRDFVFDFPSDPIAQSSLEIGPTSGITNAQLKRDAFIINAAAVEAAATQVGGFAVGGGFNSGDAAGRYTFELVPNVAVPGVAASGGDIPSDNGLDTMTFVAQQVGASGNLISVVIVERTSGGGGVQISVSGSSIVVSVPNGGATASAIATAITDPGNPSSTLIGSVNFTVAGYIYRGSGSGNFLSGGLDPVEPRRTDIGFRCMAPINYATNYPSDPEFNY